PAILRRKKQPYRAPDALSFVDAKWADELLAPRALAEVALFDERAVSALWAKVKLRRDDGQLSNADNMALVGVLSTQPLHEELVRSAPSRGPAAEWTTRIEMDEEAA